MKFAIAFVAYFAALSVLFYNAPRCGKDVTGRLTIAHSFMLAGCPPRSCTLRGGDIDIGGLTCD